MALFRHKKEEAHESALYTSLNEKIHQKEQERPQQSYDALYESNEDEVEFPDLKEESKGKLDFDHLFDGEPSGKVDVFDTDYTEDEIQNLMVQKTSEEEVIERVRNKVREEFGDRILSERKNENFQMEISKAILEALMDEGGVVRDVSDRERLHTRIFNLIVGLGPLEFLFNQGYSEIMVSRYDKIFVEEKGKMKLTNVRFSSETELRQIVDQILAPLGRKATKSLFAVMETAFFLWMKHLFSAQLIYQADHIWAMKHQFHQSVWEDLIQRWQKNFSMLFHIQHQ